MQPNRFTEEQIISVGIELDPTSVSHVARY